MGFLLLGVPRSSHYDRSDHWRMGALAREWPACQFATFDFQRAELYHTETLVVSLQNGYIYYIHPVCSFPPLKLLLIELFSYKVVPITASGPQG